MDLLLPERVLLATAHAITRYEKAAERLFRREDRLRSIAERRAVAGLSYQGAQTQADVCHPMGLIAGHAAYLEIVNPEPRELE